MAHLGSLPQEGQSARGDGAQGLPLPGMDNSLGNCVPSSLFMMNELAL